jgi:uncharacterized protein YprB with RNaseH-like and TPR domain
MKNIANLKKEEIVKRFNFKCTHGHNGLEHPTCYAKDNRIKESIGIVDIETSNLKANWGFVFSYCLKSEDGALIKRILTAKEIKDGIYDKELMRQFCIDVRKFDRLIGYYSARFDIPFLRTRALYHGLDFPIFKEIKHTDLYDITKRKLSLHSKRLQVVADFFGIKSKGHPMNPSVWFKAMAGDEKALKWIMIHNIEDVDTTLELWNRLNDYSRITDTSI